MLEFYVESGTGVAPYAQIVQQVKQALRLGWLQPGDQLPTVQDVAASVAINANTVQKAYRELEHGGLVSARPGQGTFVRRSLSQASASTITALSRRLTRWVTAARGAGLDDDAIMDIMRATLRAERADRIA